MERRRSNAARSRRLTTRPCSHLVAVSNRVLGVDTATHTESALATADHIWPFYAQPATPTSSPAPFSGDDDTGLSGAAHQRAPDSL